MGREPSALVALLKGLVRAPGYSLRFSLLALAGIAVGLAVWSAVSGHTAGLVGGLGASVALVLLAIVSQHVAVRTGAVERDAAREEELRAEVRGWPRWKQISFLIVALTAGVTVIVLRIWSNSWSPD